MRTPQTPQIPGQAEEESRIVLSQDEEGREAFRLRNLECHPVTNNLPTTEATRQSIRAARMRRIQLLHIHDSQMLDPLRDLSLCVSRSGSSCIGSRSDKGMTYLRLLIPIIHLIADFFVCRA